MESVETEGLDVTLHGENGYSVWPRAEAKLRALARGLSGAPRVHARGTFTIVRRRSL